MADLPKLVDRVDACLLEGRELSGDLDRMLNPKSKGPAVSDSRTRSGPLCATLGISISQIAAQPQMTYPMCNEQSVRAGADAVGAQVERLGRDKQLLQDQVRLMQGRIDHTDEIAK